jgi:hypothetical protein
MEITRSFKKVPRLLAAAAVMSTLTVGAVALSSSPAFATGGPLTGVSLAVSNNASNFSGGGALNSGVTYTWGFTTATTGTLDQITFTVPPGTPDNASLTLPGTLSGITCSGTTTAAVSSQLVTVTLPALCSVPANTGVSIPISGFENTPTPISNSLWTSTVTTYTLPSTQVDTGTTNDVNFPNNSTGVTVVVPQSLTFTNNGPLNIGLFPVPGFVATAPAVTVGVSTNNPNGYFLSGCVLAPITDQASLLTPKPTIPQANPPSLPVAAGNTAFGAEATVAPSGGTGAPTTGWSGSTYSGYSTTCTSSGHDVIMADAGAASGDIVTLTNAASVTAVQAAGTYTGTITYAVTPGI